MLRCQLGDESVGGRCDGYPMTGMLMLAELAHARQRKAGRDALLQKALSPGLPGGRIHQAQGAHIKLTKGTYIRDAGLCGPAPCHGWRSSRARCRPNAARPGSHTKADRCRPGVACGPDQKEPAEDDSSPASNRSQMPALGPGEGADALN